MTDSATFTTPVAGDEDLEDLPPEILPPDGSTIGNQSAREARNRAAEREESEAAYEASKNKALALSLARKRAYVRNACTLVNGK